MDRTVYNNCMKPYISGPGRSKEERRLGFCVGAKICSGKAHTEEQAVEICRTPKVPKWAQGKDEEQPITCPQRTTRARGAIEQLKTSIQEGSPDTMVEVAAQAVNDIFACHKDEGTLALVQDAFAGFKDLSGRAYMKGEGNEVRRNLDLVGALL